MENVQYFILEGDIQQGPFTLDELKQIPLMPRTKVWHSGLAKWTKAAALPELQEAMSLFPPEERSGRKWIVTMVVLLVLAGAGFAGGKYLFGKEEARPKADLPKLNNQQLYTLYAPGVVLIQHQYMYEVSTGVKKFYFNQFYDLGYPGYLAGLTEDSSAAAEASEPIQGTGFFVSQDGKLLTNRHVAVLDPNVEEQEAMAVALVRQLNSQADRKSHLDSVRNSKVQLDSLLWVQLGDTTSEASQVADTKQKIAEAEEVLAAVEEEGSDGIQIDQEAVNTIASSEITVRKITIDLRIFLPGTNEIHSANGIHCTVIANAADPEVDLALLQTNNKRLPHTAPKLPDLSRIKNSNDEGQLPQMSERLVIIGYNEGSELGKTTDGIKAQLTEGKISQNSDRYKLMYTIPTLPGSSGSPVLDEKGRLVSVNFAGITGTQSFNYGIHPRQIRSFLRAQEIVM